jgi:hypothetical protein
MSVVMTRTIAVAVTVEAHNEVACNAILDAVENRLWAHTPKRYGMVGGIKYGTIKRVARV